MQPFQVGATRLIEAPYQAGPSKRIEAPFEDSAGIVGRIQRRFGGSSRAVRWALYRPDGEISNTFAADLNRDGVAALLADSGLTVRADNTVVRRNAPRAATAFAPSADAELLGLVMDFHHAAAEVTRCDAACRASGENDPAADAAWDAALDVQDEIERRILPVTPRTIEGLAAKAAVVRAVLQGARQPGEVLNFDEEMADRLVLDVLALFGERADDRFQEHGGAA